MPRRDALAVAGVVLAALGVSAAALIGALMLARPAAPTGAGADASEAAAATASGGALTDGYALWALRADGTPARWSPCTPIPWVLRVASAPEGARVLAETAIARISEATGLRFVYEGPTDERPRLDRAPFQPDRYGARWAPVLIAWAPPGSGDLPLRSSDRGVTIPIAVDGVFVSGQIVLNDRRALDMDFADRATSWGATLVHEAGHLVGLDHVDDVEELMYRFPGTGPVAFAPGDLAGLAAVGAGDGACLDTGTPRPVDVQVAPRR